MIKLKPMKKTVIPILASLLTGLIVCALTYFYLCPGTIRHIEAANPLLGSEDLIPETLRTPGGISSLIGFWLAQWFYRPETGCLLTALTVCIISFLSGYTVKQNKVHPLLAIVPVLCTAATLVFPNLEELVRLLLALMLVAAYAHLYLAGLSAAWGLVALLFWPVVGTETSIAVFLGFFLISLNTLRKRTDLIFPLLGILGIGVLTLLWNRLISYIPDEERFTFQLKNPVNLIILYTTLIPFCKRFRFAFSEKAKKIFEAIACLLPIIAIPLHFQVHNNKPGSEEEFRQLEQAAEDGDWLKVKSITANQQTWSSPLYLRYALLAESELGTLGENLFHYPVHSTTDLYFCRVNLQDFSFFNSLFYKNIGVADEYMHQIFEMGTLYHPQMSARTIRHLTEAAIMQNDQKLAQKYFSIACNSQKDKVWLNQTETALNNIKDSADQSVPERSEFFIGTYLPQTEFMYMAIDSPENGKRLTYMLCSLLLEQNIKKYGEVLAFFEDQLPDQLPRAFREAYLLARTLHPQLQLKFSISEAEVKDWINFLKCKEKKDFQTLSQHYRNTYWYYFFLEQPKKLQ